MSVQELFPSYSNGREKYDIVLDDLQLIIECHGIQHYKIQTFGADAGEAVMNFQTQKFRDTSKKEIALLNNWLYLEIPYTDEKLITEDYLYDAWKRLSSDATTNLAQQVRDDPQPKVDKVHREKPAWLEERRESDRVKARAHRKEQYKRMKEFKNATKGSSGKATGSSEEEA